LIVFSFSFVAAIVVRFRTSTKSSTKNKKPTNELESGGLKRNVND
jgi:hypothetical protein